MEMEQELARILVCPACMGALAEGSDGASLECDTCDRAYPVANGIPILLADAVEPRSAGPVLGLREQC